MSVGTEYSDLDRQAEALLTEAPKNSTTDGRKYTWKVDGSKPSFFERVIDKLMVVFMCFCPWFSSDTVSKDDEIDAEEISGSTLAFSNLLHKLSDSEIDDYLDGFRTRNSSLDRMTL